MKLMTTITAITAVVLFSLVVFFTPGLVTSAVSNKTIENISFYLDFMNDGSLSIDDKINTTYISSSITQLNNFNKISSDAFSPSFKPLIRRDIHSIEVNLTDGYYYTHQITSRNSPSIKMDDINSEIKHNNFSETISEYWFPGIRIKKREIPLVDRSPNTSWLIDASSMLNNQFRMNNYSIIAILHQDQIFDYNTLKNNLTQSISKIDVSYSPDNKYVSFILRSNVGFDVESNEYFPIKKLTYFADDSSKLKRKTEYYRNNGMMKQTIIVDYENDLPESINKYTFYSNQLDVDDIDAFEKEAQSILTVKINDVDYEYNEQDRVDPMSGLENGHTVTDMIEGTTYIVGKPDSVKKISELPHKK